MKLAGYGKEIAVSLSRQFGEGIIVSVIRQFEEGIVSAVRRQLSQGYFSSSVYHEETSKIMGTTSLQFTELLSGIWQTASARLKEKYMRAFTAAWLDFLIMQQLTALITSLSTIEQFEKEHHKYSSGGTEQ